MAISECLRSVRMQLVQRDQSFELFGFDVVMDADLNPWVTLAANAGQSVAHAWQSVAHAWQTHL